MQIDHKKPHINVDYFEDLTGTIKTDTCREDGQADIGQRIKPSARPRGFPWKRCPT
ncbi:hypothetical protein [Desulfosarcina cetonica]|uniref:hypothetical protein n=1 Tax=Desulfosarcina cetonica TaxID=90730 RepID=UPI001FEF644C|nr:hypothetical protein [Desulfosarcina cetonica]